MNAPRSGAGRAILAIVLSGIWVNACEFVRNQLLLISHWEAHFRSIGLVFPSQPANAVMWVVWAFVFAGVAFVVSRRFGLWQTALIVWVMGFVMMWVVIWNLSVLPVGILPVAIPFSLVEAFGAAFICRRLARTGHR